MLNNNHLKYFIFIVALVFTLSCSTKKDTFVNRNWHALNSEYNTLYNGNIALEKGINDLKTKYNDDFWQILPVERMQVSDELLLAGEKIKNENFDRAETKATKAIQKHSMNIQGSERNMQMDEAHLMLGKARYYDQRFIPALEAFNYILYKYPNSDKIYEAKIWREKTNIRLQKEDLAIKNLKRLINKNQLQTQVKADANAILAQAFITIAHKDSAIAPLKKAIIATKHKEEKARYHFILGQIYQSLDQPDSANIQFQEIINMKRNAPKPYTIRAHAKQAELLGATTDSILFLKKYKKLLKDPENKPFLDVLNFQVARFYQKQNQPKQAILYYKQSLKNAAGDTYLNALAYKNLATIYFDKTNYAMAQIYYDSTLTKLTKKDREYFGLLKKRDNLAEVIKYETIATTNDSILKICALSESQKIAYFEKHILKLQQQEIQTQKNKLVQNTQNNSSLDLFNPTATTTNVITPTNYPDNIAQEKGLFYFYNPTTVAYGKLEFQKKWGKRALKDNWRLIAQLQAQQPVAQTNTSTPENNQTTDPEKYKVSYYLQQLPTKNQTLDSLAKEQNFANYQLGIIYKEKFQELPLAATKLEKVLHNNPEQRLVLPVLYNLYKIYEIKNLALAQEIKNKIILEYPSTRYAELLKGNITQQTKEITNPEQVYKQCYQLSNNQGYTQALAILNSSIPQLEGDALLPKYQLLKATIIGKLRGVEEYKKAINTLITTYPESQEAKQGQTILKTSIPLLEQATISLDSTATSWKVLYPITNPEDAITKATIDKLKKYIKEKDYFKYTVSTDVYTETQNFIVVHGIFSKEYARYFADLLKTHKTLRITIPATIISSENYKTIQIKKNYNQYLDFKI